MKSRTSRSLAALFTMGISTVAAEILTGSSARAQERDFDKVEIKVHKVAGTVYMLEGAGGNIGVSVGDDGIVIVDDQFAPLAPKIKAALKGITSKPIRFLLNTHWHGDHTGGNSVFSADAPIVAHENVRSRLESGSAPIVLGKKTLAKATPPAAKSALPVITFNERLSVHLNGEEIRAIHFPHGHTDGDSIIFFTKSNVVHMGDDFVTYGFPFVDRQSGGSVRGLVTNLEKVLPQIPTDAKIIPGHGGVSGVEDVRKFTATLKEAFAFIEAEVKKGKSLEAIQKDQPLKKYEAWAKGPVKADDFIEVIFGELNDKSGKMMPH